MTEVSIHNRGSFGWCVRYNGADMVQCASKFEAIEYCRTRGYFYTSDL